MRACIEFKCKLKTTDQGILELRNILPAYLTTQIDYSSAAVVRTAFSTEGIAQEALETFF